MKLNKRQQQILQFINSRKFLTIEELAKQFSVASQTIRRDITELCDFGLVRRHHGGVGQLPSAENISFGSRQIINATSKHNIAQRIASFIPDNSSVYLGIGTTVEAVAKALLAHKGLKILTNNLNVASVFFQSKETDVLMSGGKLRLSDQDLVGDQTISFINSYFADYAVIGSGALHLERGLMDFDMDNVAITQSILKNSEQKFLAADNSKWNKKAFANVAPFSVLDKFFTDDVTDENIYQIMSKEKVELINCPEVLC